MGCNNTILLQIALFRKRDRVSAPHALLGVPFVAVTRYEGRRVTVVGAAGGNPHISLGGSWTLDGPSVSATV
ncbi:MAG TPA: hypothetical protein VMG74_08105, partial [Gaiellaceae bacterium]|nr:hypothetical protein [Gaiellaceae bacterium]